MAVTLEDIAGQIEQGLADVRAIAQRAEDEAKKQGDSTQETRNMLDAAQKRLDELEAKLARADVPSVIDYRGEKLDPETAQKREEYRKRFFNFMRKGQVGMGPDFEHLVSHTRALVEDATGEILVPEDLDAEITRTIPKLTPMWQLASTRTLTKGNRIRRRSLTEVSVGWGKLETGTTITESTMTPSEAYQYVEDLYGLTKIGEDELDDTDVALAPIISDSFARAIAEAGDTAFVVGTGHANEQPDGILNGATVTRFSAGQTGAITADDLIKLSDQVAPQYQRNSVYIVRQSTRTSMRLFKDNNGQYLWQPSLQAGTPGTFNGYQVYTQGDVPAIPAAGTAADVAIFGDIKAGYRIIERRGMTIQRLNELYTTSGLIGFKVRRRLGGGVVRAEAMRILNVPAA